MISGQFDYCAVVNGNLINKSAMLFFNIFKSAKNLIRKCPVPIRINWCLKDFDGTLTTQDLTMSQFIPEGDYKFVLRFFDNKNHTIAKTILQLNIKPQNGMDYEKFKMG